MTTAMFRTPDARFDALDWPFAPHYFTHADGLRQHFIDERPDGPERGTFLLLHGEPTWAFLYRDWIDPLVADGYRVVAPDHLGFGRSDKPTDDNWYRISKHRDALHALVTSLDLRDITLVVQDWGGPIGLCNAVDDRDRYARLVILNTWLHTDDHEYSDGIRWWREVALDPAQLGGDMPVGTIVASTVQRSDAPHSVDAVRDAFDAPFPNAKSKAGARRFPFCIPFAEPELGDADLQTAARAALRTWDIPKHVVFGDADPVFTWEWAEQWAAELPDATLDRIAGAHHFLQIEAPHDTLAAIRSHLD